MRDDESTTERRGNELGGLVDTGGLESEERGLEESLRSSESR